MHGKVIAMGDIKGDGFMRVYDHRYPNGVPLLAPKEAWSWNDIEVGNKEHLK